MTCEKSILDCVAEQFPQGLRVASQSFAAEAQRDHHELTGGHSSIPGRVRAKKTALHKRDRESVSINLNHPTMPKLRRK